VQELISFITTVGFPVAVASYLLFRFEKVIDNNTKAINELKIKIIEKE